MPDAPQAGTALAVGGTVAVGGTLALVGTVAVAFSGGRDSLALLHVSCRAARVLGLQVVALHVHHGLLSEADDWLRSVRRLCRRWQRRGWPVRLRWARLQGSPAPGDSTEAWARRGRHAALDRLAKEEGATLLLLAQHRRDQAETFLLQALRGGGPAGLSAMPVQAERAGLTWARPWLDQPRAAIEHYVQRFRLQAVDDPSNADPAFARNRLRLQVWPALTEAFGGAEAALAAAACRAQEAAAALAELAALDLAPLVDAQGRLQVDGWRQLSAARQANALRAWWSVQVGRGAPQALVGRLLAEVPLRGAARWPAGDGFDCRLYRGWLQVVGPVAETRPVAEMEPAAGMMPVSGCRAAVALAAFAATALHSAFVVSAPSVQPAWPAMPASPALPSSPANSTMLDCSHPGRWLLPGWPGCIEVSVVDPASAQLGLSPSALSCVQTRARAGGEQFQRSPRSLPRSLKKQFQAAGVPEHQRAVPLLWSADGQLLFVPGLGPDARHWAPAGQPALALRWCADAGLPAPAKPAL